MNAWLLRNQHGRWRVDLRLLRRIACAALTEVPTATEGPRIPAQVEVTVLLVGARRMASLNKRFLGHSGPTDVITFDYAGTSPSRFPGLGLRGDIFICVDEARRQAVEFGTTWPAEVVRYLVHGLLHLCGYDDREPEARRHMKRAENRIVRRLASRFAFKRLGRVVNVRR